MSVQETAPKAALGEEPGCRPCCSMPHGHNAKLTAILATVAWLLSMVAVNNCHYLTPNYMYCHPPPEPKPLYGSCGDCHCINGDKECPSDPKEIPLTDVPDDWLRQLKNLEAKNPYQMTCNMYNTTDRSCTNPPQLQYQIDLWETAVCGLTYDMETLDQDNCPTQYTLKTYDSKEEMLEAEAEMTHWGACGACSTTKDFAVYLEYPDLTGKGQECAVRGLIEWSDGIACFMEVGYTYNCATAWMYNVLNTRDHCFDVCIDFTFFGDGYNNGPPPECKIANCLLCDERMSGPGFQTVAARSRRRSGLLSKIVRPCETLLIVDHKPPCNVSRSKLLTAKFNSTGRHRRHLQSSTKIVQPEKFRPPEPTATCVYITTDLGLGGYAGTADNNWLGLPELFLSQEQRDYNSLYATCYRYDFAAVLSGFWSNQKKIFGSAYNAALAFGIIGCLLGGICTILCWCSFCCAYGNNVWKTIGVIYFFVGLCILLTLLFFASDVCALGCKMGQASYFAIAAGLLWEVTGFCAFLSQPFDQSIPKATCCCCPTPITLLTAAYNTIPTTPEASDVVTEIVVVEKEEEDGSKVVEKTITYPDGRTSVERTIYKRTV